MNDKHEKDLEKIRQDVASIPQDVLDAFLRRLERYSYSARLDAHLAVRNSLFAPKTITRCLQTDLLIISGRDWTDSTGVINIPILFCGDVTGDTTQLAILREPNFVATPHGSTPSFVTTITHSTPRQLSNGEVLLGRAGRSLSERNVLIDVSVDIMTWRGNEASAPNIEVSWVGVLEAARLLFLGG
jgi:hypothetical protein